MNDTIEEYSSITKDQINDFMDMSGNLSILKELDNYIRQQVIDENFVQIPKQEHKSVELREYQKELFKNSIDKNSIIYLETGTGKTLVTISLLYYYLAKNPNKKIIFLANTIQLVEQQAKSILKHLPLIQNQVQQLSGCQDYDLSKLHMYVLHGDKNIDLQNNTKWKIIKDIAQIFVGITAVVLNILRKGLINMEEVSCIIFDECHHCDNDHLYNVLMREFYFTALEKEKIVPTIVGTTASPITDSNSNQDSMLALVKLAIQLDSNYSNYDHDSVSKYVQDGQINILEYNLHPRLIVEGLENFLKQYSIESLPDMDGFYLRMQEVYPYLETILNEIENIYFQCFMISQEQKNLKKFGKEWNKYLKLNSIKLLLELGDYALYLFFDEMQDQLLERIHNQEFPELNGQKGQILVPQIKKALQKILSQLEPFREPQVKNYSDKLNKLINSITQELKKNTENDFCLIIFAQERLLSYYLQRILKEEFSNNSNNNLSTDLIMGHSQSGNNQNEEENLFQVNSLQDITEKVLKDIKEQKRGILQDKSSLEKEDLGKTNKNSFLNLKFSFNRQLRVIEKFRNKELNILVSTKVTEEGFDIPQCNLVYNYSHIENFRSYIQMKGRARRLNSSFNQLCLTEHKTACDKTLEEYKRLNEFLKKGIKSLSQKNFEVLKQKYKENYQIKQSYFEYMVIEETGAQLSSFMAHDLLDTFCQSLDQQTYRTIKGSFKLEMYQIKNTQQFTAIVKLPLNLYKWFYYFNLTNSTLEKKKDAERSACYNVCKSLIEQKLINENLKPVQIDKFKYM